MATDGAGARRLGRAPATSRAQLASAALELFTRHGFDATTVDDVAAATGISRRTFFRYFASKNDLVWGDFDDALAGLEADLAAAPATAGLMDVVIDAVVAFNTYPPDVLRSHRQRMALILGVPALQAHSALRYRAWRGVLARFAASRLRTPVDSLGPQLVGHLALGAAVAAYERWLREEDAVLTDLLATSLGALRHLEPAALPR